jgi:dienelactone hydrolase
MLLGGADDWTPPAPCQRLAAGLPGRVEAVTFAGAQHGFDRMDTRPVHRTLPDGRTVTAQGNPEARAGAIARVEAFLARHGGVAP